MYKLELLPFSWGLCEQSAVYKQYQEVGGQIDM